MSPRESIEMTSDEIDEFLRTRGTVVLATLRPDGRPDATIVPCRYEAGVLALSVDDPVRAAITADDRVSCGVEACPSYYEIRGVTVHGHAVAGADGWVRVPVDDCTSFDFGKIRERPS